METKYIVNNASEQTINSDVTINGNLTVTGTTNTRPYKVYTALLTQSGGYFLDQLDYSTPTQNVSKGVTYNISTTDIGADFTNVGAPNNEEGTYFVAINDEIPNSWGESEGSSLTFNTGAPRVFVLENTTGDIWFDYTSVGVYSINSNSLFGNNSLKVPSINGVIYDIGTNNTYYTTSIYSSSSIIEISSITGGDRVDDVFNNTFIEIRVYN